MGRDDWNYVVIGAMLLSGLYVLVTGLVADLMGLHQFFWHRYAGYACAVLAALHLALSWRRVRARLGRWRRGARLGRGEEGVASPGRRSFLVAALAAVGGFAVGRLLPGGRAVDLSDGVTDLGELYHRWSAGGRLSGLGALSDWGTRPARYKVYAGAERVALPDPGGFRGLSVEEAIEVRRSIRRYSAESLPFESLSRLLYAAQGITARRSGFRAAPSAGALYPIEVYVVVNDVVGLSPGLYHYAVADHELERLRGGNLGGRLVVAGVGQEMLGQANVCFVLSAVFQRTRWKYRERAYRYVLLEAGHIGQNVYLAAASMGLGACAVGAFFDDALNGLLGIDGREEAAVYLLAVGMV